MNVYAFDYMIDNNGIWKREYIESDCLKSAVIVAKDKLVNMLNKSGVFSDDIDIDCYLFGKNSIGTEGSVKFFHDDGTLCIPDTDEENYDEVMKGIPL